MLQRFCEKFFDFAYHCDKYLNYTALFELPDTFIKEINPGSNEPVHFHWLKGDELKKAKMFKFPSLDDIPNPPRVTPPASSNPSSAHDTTTPPNDCGCGPFCMQSFKRKKNGGAGSVGNRPQSNTGDGVVDSTEDRENIRRMKSIPCCCVI